MRPAEDAELDGATEAKGSEPSRSTFTQPSAEVDDGPPGVFEDSDSDDDRPSRWAGAQSRLPIPEDDVPDLIDDGLKPAQADVL